MLSVFSSCSRPLDISEVQEKVKGLSQSGHWDEASSFVDQQLQAPRWQPGSNEHWVLKLLKAEQLSEDRKCDVIGSILNPGIPQDELLNAERRMHLAYCNRDQPSNDSRVVLESALEVANKHKFKNLSGRILMRLGAMDHEGNRLEDAQRKFELALSQAKDSKDEKLIASCLLDLALTMQSANRLDEALHFGEEARNRFANLKHQRGFAFATRNLGSYSIRLGDIDRAKTLLEEAQVNGIKQSWLAYRTGKCRRGIG